MEDFSDIIREIHNIVKCETSFSNDTDVLFFIHNQMKDVLMPLLRLHIKNATEYCKNRDECNVKLHNILFDEQCQLNKLFINEYYISVNLMSSVGAKLNTITESDIDFGICVLDLNNNLNEDQLDFNKLEKVSNLLKTIGYEYKHNFNYYNPSNRYFSYSKMINGVEIEAKIRDLKTSEIFLKLHEKLDNTLTEEQIVLYTYTKHVLYQDKNAYKYFKKILYESIFYGIDGAFVFPMP